MANAFSIVKIVLMVFLVIVLVLMLVYFVQAILSINRNEHRKSAVNSAITTSLIAANAVLGLVGSYKEHFLFTLIFAILQTVLIILGIFLHTELWFAIPWIGSAILAYVFAFMIRQGHTAA